MVPLSPARSGDTTVTSGLPGEILDHLPDGILVADQTGRIRFANRRMSRLSGYDRDSLQGVSVERLVPDRMREEHREEREAYNEDPERRPMAAGRRLQLQRRDGTEIPVDIALSPLQTSGERFVCVAVRDLRRHRELERARHRAHRAYRKLFEANAAGGFRCSLEGEILEANQAFADMLGYGTPSELEDRNVSELYMDPADLGSVIDSVHRRGSLENRELALRRRDGSTAWIVVNAVTLEDPELEDDVVMGTAIDVSDRKESERRLSRMATRDTLTGLPNRRLLRDRVEQALSMSRRRESRIALVFIDLGDFKKVNDRLGHAAGDRLLRQVAERLRDGVRDTDTAARVGGDEFAVLLPEVGDVGAARKVVERLSRCCAERFLVAETGPVSLDASFGVAVYPEHGETFDELMDAADEAMYRAKDDGGTAVAVAGEGRGNVSRSVADRRPA